MVAIIYVRSCGDSELLGATPCCLHVELDARACHRTAVSSAGAVRRQRARRGGGRCWHAAFGMITSVKLRFAAALPTFAPTAGSDQGTRTIFTIASLLAAWLCPRSSSRRWRRSSRAVRQARAR